MPKTFVDLLNENSGAVQGFSSVILVFVTAYYAWQSNRTVKEAEKARKDSRLPIVEVELSGPMNERNGEKYIDVTLNNTGAGLATDLVVTVPNKKPITLGASLAVGGSLSQRIDLDVDEDRKIMELSTAERVLTIEYRDIFKRTIQTVAWIDQDRPVEWIEFVIRKWRLKLPK